MLFSLQIDRDQKLPPALRDRSTSLNNIENGGEQATAKGSLVVVGRLASIREINP